MGQFNNFVVHHEMKRKGQRSIEEAVEQEEKLFNDVKTLKELTYKGDVVSSSGE